MRRMIGAVLFPMRRLRSGDGESVRGITRSEERRTSDAGWRTAAPRRNSGLNTTCADRCHYLVLALVLALQK